MTAAKSRGGLRAACWLALAASVVAPAAHAGNPDATWLAPTYNDWGGAGLWQTPTARMVRDGEFAFTASHVSPYTRYNFLLQPLPWLQVVFRYSDINNRPYGAPELSGNQTYKDKSIDAKVRLWREDRYRPAVSVGIRDLAGTGLFSGEYVVANKRFGAFDASLGLGWGYVGARGNLPNPLAVFGSRFKHRPPPKVHQGGEFSSHTYFRGRTSLFGGVSWQTPWQPLVVKLEYDGNDYRHEPFDNNQHTRTPWNLGVVYRPNANWQFSAAIERGNTALFSLTLHGNPGHRPDPPKPLDPPAPPPPRPAPQTRPADVDWADASRALESNAGIRVATIAQRGRELVVTGEPERYYYDAQTVGRMARVLDRYVGPGIDWYTLAATQDGLPVVDTSIDRARFDAFIDHRITLEQLGRAVEQDQPLPQPEQVLYRQPLRHYAGGFWLGYRQTVGGPDAFILYEVSGNYDANFFFAPGVWLSGTISANLVNNYDKFTYDAPSELPRVRTHVRKYLTTARVTLPVFQLTAARRIAPDWYAMAYGGMLEMMYGGVGGEVLYRPFGKRWALGADINWVKQRDFDQRFGFRPYHVTTGHVTGYFDTGLEGMVLRVSAGRYLAGDWGGTIDVSRRFDNGVRFGAWATFTSADGKQFGEGSFDKGIYVSIPFTLFLPRSSRSEGYIAWQPLLRDGGAALERRYTLYDLTRGRDGANFHDNLQHIGR